MVLESWSLYQIETRIRAALVAPLPGDDAHRLLAPRPRRGWAPGYIPAGSKSAAALILLYPLYDTPHFLLIVRAGKLAQHAGQVALPGGMLEPNETVRDAALREATEEVGIDAAQVDVLGTLTPLYIPVSGFALHPVIGLTETAPALRAAATEVDRIMQVPLNDLLNPVNLRCGTRWRGDQQCQVPYFALQEERVWGATAMVLTELLGVLGAPPSVP